MSMGHLIESYIRALLDNKFSFKNYLNEIDMTTIQKHLRQSEALPFENIFKGKLRILAPFSDDKSSKLEDIMRKEGYEVDFKAKKAQIVKKNNDPRAKGRDNKIVLNLGKAINNLIRRKEKSKDFENLYELKWLYKVYQEESDNFDYQAEDSEYAIVLSRAPVDVLRMSDFDWSSCHAKGKDYFHCAVQEAQSGGAIAYLVNKEDVEGLDLQSPEIFTDNERDIDGIDPLGRIRVRNIENIENGMSLAIPELKMYGDNPGAFRDSVTRFLSKEQPEIFSEEPPNPDHLMLKGGGYADNDPSILLNNFIGKGIYSTGEIRRERDKKDRTDAYGDNIDGNNAEQTAEQMVEEIQEYIRNLGDDVFNFDANSEYYDEETYYVQVYVGFSMELGEEIIDILEGLPLRKGNEIIREALEIFGIESPEDWDISGRYLQGSVSDQDNMEMIGNDHDGDIYDLRSTIDYYVDKELQEKDFAKILKNILVRDEYIQQDLGFDFDELEEELGNLEIGIEDDISEDDFGIVYASVLVGDLRQSKDSQAREEIRKIVDSEGFVKAYYEKVVSQFSPNLNQLILPYVEIEPSAPLRASLYNPYGDKYYIKVGFNLENDNAEDFVNFLRMVNSHVGQLRDLFVGLVQEFIGKELLETNVRLVKIVRML